MADLARVVSVLPDGRLNHNVLRNAITLLGEAIEARGVEHRLLDGNQPDFQRDLLRHLADPCCAVYLGHRYFDLGFVHSDAQGRVRRNLFEALDRPVFATIQDHPFSEFMWSRIEAASRTTHFAMPSAEFVDEARFINPALTQFHTLAPAMTEPLPAADEIRPLSERSVDIFMSCAFFIIEPHLEDLARQYAAANDPMKGVIDEVYETGMAERDRPLLRLFLEAYRRAFGEPLTVGCPMTRRDRAVMRVLSCIDNRIRFDRRMRVLRQLAQLDPALRIVVTLAPSAGERLAFLGGRDNIRLTGRIDAASARRLYLDARFAINVSPTYVSFVTERVSNAMALGCCVVSDRNSHIAATFAGGEEILFLDDSGVGGLSAWFGERLDQAQAIATRGRAKALERFAVARQADDLLAIMRAVL